MIPTSRAGRDLAVCLRSVAAERYPGVEVIIVDNGSPGVPEVDASPELRVVRNDENRGFAEACNQGIEAASGEHVLLLNDDTELQAGSLDALVGTLVARPSWGACQAKLLLAEEPTLLDTAGSFLTATGFLVHRGALGPEEAFAETDEIFAAKGAALLLRRRAVAEVGGFDEDFFAYFEETDLCWRLWLAGWEVGYVAEARVLHRMGSTSSSMPSEIVQFHSFKNRICTLLKNLGSARLAWVLPYHLSLCLGLAGWYALHGRLDLARAILRAIGWNVGELSTTLGKRRRIQSRRRVPDRRLMPRIMTRTAPRELLAYARTAGASRD